MIKYSTVLQDTTICCNIQLYAMMYYNILRCILECTKVYRDLLHIIPYRVRISRGLRFDGPAPEERHFPLNSHLTRNHEGMLCS